MGRGKSKMYSIEVILLIVLGMSWVSLIPIKPSSAQGLCWKTIIDCLEEHFNQTLKPEFDENSPSFNQTEFFCCNLVKETAESDKPCFCSMNAILHRDSNATAGVVALLNVCRVIDFPSLATFDTFCSVDPTSPSTPPEAPVSGPPAPASIIEFPPSDASTPPKASPASKSPHSPSSGKKTVIIIALAASSAVLLLLIALGVILYIINSKKKPRGGDAGIVTQANIVQPAAPANVPPPPRHPHPPVVLPRTDTITPESLQYDFGALKAATNNFSDYNRVRGDGFGAIYKGTLPNGQEVAIKRLSTGSWRGEEEFMNEVTLVAKLQHRNLVRLVGFCLVNEERLLVYEFVHNRSLDYFLFDHENKKQLDWSKRYKIIGGIARGLLYLHEDSPTRIIHRDLKAMNIMLEQDMNPKISDFGMARIFHFEQTQGNTSRIIGTYGYMAPEYLIHGKFSVKSDVYSFGVLILEIISGKKINPSMYRPGSAGENLLSDAWKCFRDGRPLDFMDPRLRHSYSRDEVIRCIHLGLLCVQDDPRRRPTMGKVVVMLNSDTDVGSLLLPEYPGGLQAKFTEQSSTGSASYVPWPETEDGAISKPNAR